MLSDAFGVPLTVDEFVDATVTIIPEASTALLLAAGLAGLRSSEETALAPLEDNAREYDAPAEGAGSDRRVPHMRRPTRNSHFRQFTAPVSRFLASMFGREAPIPSGRDEKTRDSCERVTWLTLLPLALVMFFVAESAAPDDPVCPADMFGYLPLDESTAAPFLDHLGVHDGACGGSACRATRRAAWWPARRASAPLPTPGSTFPRIATSTSAPRPASASSTG